MTLTGGLVSSPKTACFYPDENTTNECLDSQRTLEIVGNKTKERISKWVFQENKARQIF